MGVGGLERYYGNTLSSLWLSCRRNRFERSTQYFLELITYKAIQNTRIKVYQREISEKSSK